MKYLIISSLFKSTIFGITLTIARCGFPLPPIWPSMVMLFLLYSFPCFIACLLGEVIKQKMKEK